MPDWLPIMFRPLAAVALLAMAAVIAWGLNRLIPDGRIKRALYAKQPLIPAPGEPRPWLGIAVLLCGTLAVMAWILWYTGAL